MAVTAYTRPDHDWGSASMDSATCSARRSIAFPNSVVNTRSGAVRTFAYDERGREVLMGGFPSRFPDLKNELQVTGKRLQTGPSSALYDVRLGEDMHVLVGCGLGGGSLINSSVKPSPSGLSSTMRWAMSWACWNRVFSPLL